ncbi:hypothetical protein Asulf_00746 [Archaeoglobus sulfaticallidus PM70-1]|uniref:UPF0215 protein Asulf_00746 n=1 Tax=Archaeoglobus sulfaticallidus PM70-1 TaxID=387631 RepID=N0BAX5_9EURY|nr:DUF99 family protein [Archaeoglobus sulfaticallidus]AGK60759.1 hypothetical protein Asulf_00746 [Archaeoglobus sulfaticallidus PM70-1]
MKNWRFVGFDDSFRISSTVSDLKGEKAVIVGCVTSGFYPEGFMVDRIEVDGDDSTDKMIRMVKRSKFHVQLKCIFLSGLTFGGFNIADISRIAEETGIAVVVVMRKKPDFSSIKHALCSANLEDRWLLIEKAGEVFNVGELFIQKAGCTLEEAKKFIRLSVKDAKIPEPLRLAHMVASAIVHGESKRG